MVRQGLCAYAALGAMGVLSSAAPAADLRESYSGSVETIADQGRGAAGLDESAALSSPETAAMYGLDPSEFEDVGVLEVNVARVVGALGMEVDRNSPAFLGRVALHVVDDPRIGASAIVTDLDDPYVRSVERAAGPVTVYDVSADGQRTLPRRGLRLDYSYTRPMTSSLPGEMEVAVEPRANVLFGQEVSGVGGGAVVRFGRNLTKPREESSRWYAFIGADAQALTWSLGGGGEESALRLEDKQLVGDYQVGVARRIAGGDLALGFVHREVKWKDYSRDEQFVGVSFTARR